MDENKEKYPEAVEKKWQASKDMCLKHKMPRAGINRKIFRDIGLAAAGFVIVFAGAVIFRNLNTGVTVSRQENSISGTDSVTAAESEENEISDMESSAVSTASETSLKAASAKNSAAASKSENTKKTDNGTDSEAEEVPVREYEEDDSQASENTADESITEEEVVTGEEILSTESGTAETVTEDKAAVSEDKTTENAAETSEAKADSAEKSEPYSSLYSEDSADAADYSETAKKNIKKLLDTVFNYDEEAEIPSEDVIELITYVYEPGDNPDEKYIQHQLDTTYAGILDESLIDTGYLFASSDIAIIPSYCHINNAKCSLKNADITSFETGSDSENESANENESISSAGRYHFEGEIAVTSSDGAETTLSFSGSAETDSDGLITYTNLSQVFLKKFIAAVSTEEQTDYTSEENLFSICEEGTADDAFYCNNGAYYITFTNSCYYDDIPLDYSELIDDKDMDHRLLVTASISVVSRNKKETVNLPLSDIIRLAETDETEEGITAAYIRPEFIINSDTGNVLDYDSSYVLNAGETLNFTAGILVDSDTFVDNIILASWNVYEGNVSGMYWYLFR